MNQEEQKTGPFIRVVGVIILLALGGFYLSERGPWNTVPPSQAATEEAEIASLEQETASLSADSLDADLADIETVSYLF